MTTTLTSSDGADPELPDFLWGADDLEHSAPPDPISERPTDETRGHTPGEPGLWIFLIGDMTLFGVILLVTLWERRADPRVFAVSAEQLLQPVGAVNTMVLLLSSYLVVLAVAAQRRGRLAATQALVGGALACAVVFAGLKIFEYHHAVAAGNTPSTNLFFTFYFVLTGLHLLHVVVGAALLSVWAGVLRRRPWESARRAVEGIAAYWHMVDLLWIAIFTILYLVCAE